MREPSARPARRGLALLLFALFAVGFVARVAPLFERDGRLLQQYPTEDGYLMLTIARNIALGHGMSTAEGTIPTNGTQPLVNLLWALGFKLFGGDRTLGVLFAQILQVGFSLLAAWALYRLGRRLLGERPHAHEASALGAAAWYATLLSTTHGMNCLETGAYALAVVLFALAFVGKEGDPLAPWSLRRALGLGLALGVVFWVRIDSVFLILGTCVARTALGERGRFAPSLRNLGAACITGATSVVVASPWLLYNKLGFGSFMPISGTAQSWAAGFGQNLTQAIANAAEYALVVAPIPQPLERQPLVNAACALVLVVAAVVLVRQLRTANPALRAWFAVGVVFGGCLFGYYGLVFGAPHFVGRYLYPLSPFLALLWGAVAWSLHERTGLGRSRLAGAVLWLGLLALVAYPNVRQYGKGARHQHFQVVEWVEAHVGDEEWVGAVQTGTLGFFHDRTLNLDGKVNPEALAAARERRIPEYVVEKGLAYLADWEGIAAWVDDYETIREHFELVVHDREANLAVLRRKERLAASR